MVRSKAIEGIVRDFSLSFADYMSSNEKYEQKGKPSLKLLFKTIKIDPYYTDSKRGLCPNYEFDYSIEIEGFKILDDS